MADLTTIQSALHDHIVGDILLRKTSFGPTEDLFAAGFDSMSLSRVLVFVEERFGVTIPDQDVVLDEGVAGPAGRREGAEPAEAADQHRASGDHRSPSGREPSPAWISERPGRFRGDRSRRAEGGNRPGQGAAGSSARPGADWECDRTVTPAVSRTALSATAARADGDRGGCVWKAKTASK